MTHVSEESMAGREPILNMSEVMAGLAGSRRVFHSEADFQHALAWHLASQEGVRNIRLEKCLTLNGRRMSVDVVAQRNGIRFAMELKYWKKALEVADDDELFVLNSRSAIDISCYDFWKDVRRVEDCVDAGLVDEGWVIALTNEPAYWKIGRSETAYAAFRLHEGRRVSRTLSWADSAGRGTIRGREQPLTLKREFGLQWFDYSKFADKTA